jgi:hypothetical protein
MWLLIVWLDPMIWTITNFTTFMNSEMHNFVYKNQKQSQPLLNSVFFTPNFFIKHLNLKISLNFFTLLNLISYSINVQNMKLFH